jgi:protocatechuate 3,4-dioxygenase beta subunit
MNGISRRQLLTAGLAALGTGGLVLRAGAQPTPQAGDLEDLEEVAFFAQNPPTPELKPTEDCILGPFYRPGAPYRAKVTPPLEPGTVMLIRGRVWAADTRKPLAAAQLDVWQANAVGRYDNDDPKNPPQKGVFKNRARLITDEEGYYEFETIHPGAYQIGENAWRPSHIHYLVQAPGYNRLITQLFFKGDKHNATDEFIKASLIIELANVRVGAQAFESGVFDIVLARAPGPR